MDVSSMVLEGALQEGTYLVDAVEGLKRLPDGSVDLILSDPAYCSMEKHRAVGSTTRLKRSDASSNDWFPVVQFDYFDEYMRQCHRVLKRGSYMFTMCDDETSDELKPRIVAAGFTWRRRLVWFKHSENPQPQKCEFCRSEMCCRVCGTQRMEHNPMMGMGYPFRRAYEFIIFAEKGKRPAPDDRTVLDVFEDPAIKRPDAYPTEKPQSLLKRLISQATDEGAWVVDPFSGSGSALLAARSLGRRAIGFDVTPKAIQWQVDHGADGSVVQPDQDNPILDLFG